MNKDRGLSVAMCVYGGDNPDTFDVAVKSVINQTYCPYEIVIVIDGPIPNTIETVIRKYREQLMGSSIKMNVIRLEKNMGHGEARKICIENCSCDLIALMDADDISVSERFEKQIDYFNSHSDVSVVGGNITEFIDSSQPEDISNTAGKRIVAEGDSEIKEYMKRRCPMNQVTVMFKKADIAAVGGYIDWYCEEDFYLWIRLALAGKKFGNICENLVYVRVGEEMYRRRGGMRYFISEAKLQKLMLQKHIITFPRFLVNVTERFIVQILLPNRLRGLIFQRFARD